MTTYAVTVTRPRPGKYWAIALTGGGLTQARKLSDVETMARDLLSQMHGVPAESFDLVIHWPEEIAVYAQPAVLARTQAREAKERADAAMRSAAVALKRQGLSIRDTASLLRISPATAEKLLKRGTE